MRTKDILEFITRSRPGAKGKGEATKANGVRAKPNTGLVFEMWLNAYRDQLERFCGSHKRPQLNEQPNSNHAEAAPDSW